MRRIWIIGPIVTFVVFLPLALWSKQSYVPVKEPIGAIAHLMTFTKLSEYPGRHGYLSYASVLRGLTEKQKVALDTVVIYENGTEIGPANSTPLSIEETGLGRFDNFQGGGFYLSTSDNSDPRTNGRDYWVVVPDVK